MSKKEGRTTKVKKDRIFPFSFEEHQTQMCERRHLPISVSLFLPLLSFLFETFLSHFFVCRLHLFSSSALPYAAAATHPHQNVCRWDGEDEGGAHMCECVFHKMRRGRDLKTNSPNLNARFERMVTTFGTVTRAH